MNKISSLSVQKKTVLQEKICCWIFMPDQRHAMEEQKMKLEKIS
jgi:hypothetical protein